MASSMNSPPLAARCKLGSACTLTVSSPMRLRRRSSNSGGTVCPAGGKASPSSMPISKQAARTVGEAHAVLRQRFPVSRFAGDGAQGFAVGVVVFEGHTSLDSSLRRWQAEFVEEHPVSLLCHVDESIKRNYFDIGFEVLLESEEPQTIAGAGQVVHDAALFH